MKIISLLLLIASVAIAAPTPLEILRKADEHRGFDTDFSFVVTVKEFSGPKMLKESKYSINRKNASQTLVATIFPANQKGRKFLFVDENLWFYTPDIKRATRVTLQQRLTGEVSNGDLARTNFGNDYSAEILGEEKVGGKTAWKLGLKASNKSATYAAITYWVDKNSNVPLKASFQTAAGKVLKHCEYRNVKKVLGRDVVMEIKITDALRPTHQSVLLYSNLSRKKLDDSFFNKDALGND